MGTCSLHSGWAGRLQPSAVRFGGFRRPFRQTEPAGHAELPGENLDFITNSASCYRRLIGHLSAQIFHPADRQVGEAFTRLLLRSDNPEQLAERLLDLMGDTLATETLGQALPGLPVFLARYEGRALDEAALSLLRLMHDLGRGNPALLNRKLAEDFLDALLRRDDAEALAQRICQRFDTEMSGNPLLRLYGRLRGFMQDDLQVELLSMEDFLTTAKASGLGDERRLLLELALAELKAEKKPTPLLGVACRKLVEGIDNEAFQQASRVGGFYQANPDPGSELTAMQVLRRDNQAASLALHILEAFRREKISPPDTLIQPLLARMQVVSPRKPHYRGAELSQSYDGPVFPPAFEADYLRLRLEGARDITYPLSVFVHYGNAQAAGQQAAERLSALVRELGFAWDMRTEAGCAENSRVLGTLIKAALAQPDGLQSEFYARLRETALGYVGLGAATDWHPSSSGAGNQTLPDTRIAQVLSQALIQIVGATLPRELRIALLAKAAMHVEPPNISAPEPLPAEKAGWSARSKSASAPIKPNKPKRRKSTLMTLWGLLSGR